MYDILLENRKLRLSSKKKTKTKKQKKQKLFQKS